MIPASGGADSPTALGRHAARLGAENAALAQRSHSAVLDLYAIESRLVLVRAGLTTVEARVSALERERRETERRLRLARHDFNAAQRGIASRLRTLYEQGQTDPLAILLGADSLDEALTELESVNRVASQDRGLIEELRSARERLQRLTRMLAARAADLRRVGAALRGAESSLTTARSERSRFLARLAAERKLNAAKLGSLEARARAIVTKAVSTAPQQAPTSPAPTGPPTEDTPPAAAGRTMTVVATGYALGGRTATGAPVGWGVVAVDPSVIPLGTTLTIPGYGTGVAADTGPSVRGAMIDLWFPSVAAAGAWGRRTVTITLR